MIGEICASQSLVLIPVKLNKVGLEQSGASGKKRKAGGSTLSMTTTTNAFITISTAISPKMGFFGNMFCNNLQSANRYTLVPSLSPKSVFGNEIPAGKADLSIPCIMPKSVFVEEVDNDDDNTDFELASCIRVVFAGDNQTHSSIMGRNIARPLSEQELLGAESLKQKTT